MCPSGASAKTELGEGATSASMTGPQAVAKSGDALAAASGTMSWSKGSSSGSIMNRLRREYRACEGVINTSTLSSAWLQLAVDEHKGGSNFAGRDLQAIALRVAQHLQDMRLKSWGRESEVSEEEWMHAMLLIQAQDRAAAQIYAPLKASLAKYPNMLHNLQGLFERADSRGVAMLTKQDVSRMYRSRQWRLHPTSTDGRPLTDRELEDPDLLADQLVDAMDVDGDGLVSYVEFVAFCVGRRKKEVRLHMYDLSRGAGSQVKWLLGDDMQRIWHTGVVAFDKEYFFSSDTIFDLPGKTSFGEPTEVITLGYTFWSQDELHDFIVSDLKPLFHRDTYDVICNNCNHFSDRLSLYLAGKHLPEEILLQSKKLMDLVSVRTARPILNWMLRDCVVSRDGTARTVEVPHGKWHRIITEDEVVPGAVVAIHPQWGRGVAVLGVVCEAQEGEDDATFNSLGGAHAGASLASLGCGVYSCMPQQNYGCYVTGVPGEGASNSEVWVKYLDVSLKGWQDGGSCSSSRIRTEKMQLSRLSLATLDGITVGADYREALDTLTQQLVAKPLKRSVWGYGGKAAFPGTPTASASIANDGRLKESVPLPGPDALDAHEVPSLDAIRMTQADSALVDSPPSWAADGTIQGTSEQVIYT
eukprot:TRINITY_DN2620_c0_g1_i1.p1 TRINITY_DN2620_c0_g1~~TRINITY_DN2620_c0_g1_i1.p1  ORF type:complete len:657 (+),score=110.98 TRINITY_DN2620_c0_g1_i1:43-1971(+)